MTDHSLSGLSDAQLLERHVEGDPEAFGLLFLRHRDRLWAVALRTLCDPEEAADALQEAMISAFRRAGDFRGDSAVTTWLHRIVVNASLDRLRRKAAHAASSVGDEGRLDLLATQGRVPATTDPASHRDTTLDVEAALRLIRLSSGPRWSWSTCWATRWPTPRPCWTSRSGPSRAVAPGAGPGCCPTSSTFAAARPRIPRQKTGFHGTVPPLAASHLGREEMDEAAISARRRGGPG